MNLQPEFSIDPAYCPHLIKPSIPLPDAAEGFLPFSQYLDGVFLFHVGESFIAMDALGRTLAHVKARSASLFKTVEPLADPALCPEFGAVPQIRLEYDSYDGEKKTIIVGSFSPPIEPTGDPCHFGMYIHEPLLSRLTSFLIEDYESHHLSKVLHRYDKFSNFFEGFCIAEKNGTFTYFAEDRRQLILFKRNKATPEAPLVYCAPLAKASPFRDGFSTVKTEENCHGHYVVLPSGRCLGDRGWDEVRPICGGLIPVRSKEGWTLMNRAGEPLDSYYKQIYATPSGATFVLDDDGYRCIIPFSSDEAVPLRWQQIQEAEPGLLWALRAGKDGKYELIDCRTDHPSIFEVYSAPIEATHNVSWFEEEGFARLCTPDKEHIRLHTDDFFKYIDFLQQSLDLRYSSTCTSNDHKRCTIVFDGGRFYSPASVRNGSDEKPCSLYIDFYEEGENVCFTVAVPMMRQPNIPAVDDTQLRQEPRIPLSPKMIDRIFLWQLHNCHDFCDYQHENLDRTYGEFSSSALSEHDPDDPWDPFYYGYP